MTVSEEQKSRLFKAVQAGELEDFQAAAADIDGDIRQLHAANAANCLHLAAYSGHTELCKYLIEALQFDINAQDCDGTGSTALTAAVANGHDETVDELLSLGADPSRQGSAEGAAAPLHLAVAQENEALARKLVRAGADVNASSSSGSPLMLAAARSSAAIVEVLLTAGAAVNETSSKGLSPLFISVAVGGSAEVTELLVKAGADVNGRALGAFTPLHVAAEGGKADVAEVLLKAGADPEAQDDHGHTPAKVAAMHNHRAVVELLLRRGGGGSGGGDLNGAAGGSRTSSSSRAPDDAASAAADIDAYIKGSKAALRQREEQAEKQSPAASQPPSSDKVVVIPQPEQPDEQLADTFKRKGNDFFVAGDYEGAAKLYELSLKHWTKTATVWANRSACFLRLQRFDKALQDAQVARTLDAKYVKAWYREGRAAEGLGRWEDAATAFYQAAQLQPENDEFLRLTKEAIVKGRRALAAQQAQQGGTAHGDGTASAAGGNEAEKQ